MAICRYAVRRSHTIITGLIPACQAVAGKNHLLKLQGLENLGMWYEGIYLGWHFWEY